MFTWSNIILASHIGEMTDVNCSATQLLSKTLGKYTGRLALELPRHSMEGQARSSNCTIPIVDVVYSQEI